MDDSYEVIQTILQHMAAGTDPPDSSHGDQSWKLNERTDPENLSKWIDMAYPDHSYYGVWHHGWSEVNDILKTSTALMKYTPMVSGSLVDGTIVCLTRKPKFDFDCMFCYNGAFVKSSNILPISEERPAYVYLTNIPHEEMKDFTVKARENVYISARKMKTSLSRTCQNIMMTLLPNGKAEIEKHFHPDQSAACITLGKIVELFAEKEMVRLSGWGNDEKANMVFKIAIPIMSKTFDVELVPALTCEEWPNTNFFSRMRPQNWPDAEILHILREKTRVYLVPKCHTGGDEEKEWRYSFSAAENLLSAEMSQFHRRCLAILKNILQDVVNNKKSSSIGTEKIICSYHLKTAMFWSLEEDPLWNKTPTIGQAIAHLLIRVMKYIQEGNLPHYFMPDYNLFMEIRKEEWKNLRQIDPRDKEFYWIWKPSKIMPVMPAIYHRMLDKQDPVWSIKVVEILNEGLPIAIDFIVMALKKPKPVDSRAFVKEMFEEIWKTMIVYKYDGEVMQSLMQAFLFVLEPLFRIINTIKPISVEQEEKFNIRFADIDLD